MHLGWNRSWFQHNFLQFLSTNPLFQFSDEHLQRYPGRFPVPFDMFDSYSFSNFSYSTSEDTLWSFIKVSIAGITTRYTTFFHNKLTSIYTLIQHTFHSLSVNKRWTRLTSTCFLKNGRFPATCINNRINHHIFGIQCNRTNTDWLWKKIMCSFFVWYITIKKFQLYRKRPYKPSNVPCQRQAQKSSEEARWSSKEAYLFPFLRAQLSSSEAQIFS